MVWFDPESLSFLGATGSLDVLDDDEITRKLAMLIEGECGGLGPAQAAKKFHFSRQRYFQRRAAFIEQGALALRSRKRGPKRGNRRTDEVICQVIRHRFLDPQASAKVIAQKLRQCGLTISARSVERSLSSLVSKKTPPLSCANKLNHLAPELRRIRGS